MGARLLLYAASCVALLPLFASASLPTSIIGTGSAPGKQHVCVLDVDGTLYDDECMVETQIRDNCFIYAMQGFGYTPTECQAMHEAWGSSIRGFVGKGAPRDETFADYYNKVYPEMDMSNLRKYSGKLGGEGGGEDVHSGYHHQHVQHAEALRFLSKLTCPIVVASNSPVFHVKRVLTRLGLNNLPVTAFLTPERMGGTTKIEESFWDPLFALFPKDKYQCTLIDDNALNIALARKLGMQGIRITSKQKFAEAMLHFLDIKTTLTAAPFEFHSEAYLKSKNEIDNASFNLEVQQRLLLELEARVVEKQHRQQGTVDGTSSSELRVIDLGAGLLNMLPIVLGLCSKALKGQGKVSYLAFEQNKDLEQGIEQALKTLGFRQESRGGEGGTDATTTSTCLSNTRVYEGVIENISVTVNIAQENFMSDKALRIVRRLFGTSIGATLWQGQGPISSSNDGIDLIVGCCLADLIPPRAFASHIIDMAGDKGGLLYLPITFAGNTALQGVDDMLHRRQNSSITTASPTNDLVFATYHRHLESMGHHLSPRDLGQTLSNYGCSLLSTHNGGGSSNFPRSSWLISRSKHPYMWQCMLRFLALGTTFRLLGEWDVQSWFENLAQCNGEPSLAVENVDILAELPRISQELHMATSATEASPASTSTRSKRDGLHEDRFKSLYYSQEHAKLEYFKSTPPLHSRATTFLHREEDTTIPTKRKVVEFTGPSLVHVVEEDISEVGPSQLLLRTSCSLISTGTELKVFRGDVDSSEPADLTIKGMANSLAYPVRYGYSLVGTVVKVGHGLDERQWLGRSVFSFSSHSSAVVVDADSVLPVPVGISPVDAVFLPSMETAVSLAMAARPLLGERVAVIGQGLIGQLTGAVLDAMNVDITLVDVSARRLDSAARFVPRAFTLNPSTSRSQAGKQQDDFDTCVEVSGHPSGLQEAIDRTGKGGRVILGSWYGENPASLRLGLRFHRSGIHMQASQVSLVPPELRDRWSKERRFDLSWDMLKKIRPSRLLCNGDEMIYSTQFESKAVLKAYQALDKGELVTTLLSNDPN